MSASATRGTFKVLVSRIGVSITPSSSTCGRPIVFPNPLPTKLAAGTFWSKGLPSPGQIAVTPVRAGPTPGTRAPSP